MALLRHSLVVLDLGIEIIWGRVGLGTNLYKILVIKILPFFTVTAGSHEFA